MSDRAPFRRKLLFTALYFSEGAPIGFLWWALPARLRVAGVDVDRITAFTSLLVLPWAFKFLWAPVVDGLQSQRWTLRHWIVSAQMAMGLTLAPLLWFDLAGNFELFRWLLLAHAFSAATQDVAIDALCIRTTTSQERGRMNGWMQAGMLAGRSIFGGGALILFSYLPQTAVIGLLLAATTFSAVLVLTIDPRNSPAPAAPPAAPTGSMGIRAALLGLFAHRATWMGLAFALTAGAAFEALGALQSPMLLDAVPRDEADRWTEDRIGWLLAVPVVLAMTSGSLLGGYAADRWGHRTTVAVSLSGIIACVLAVAGLQMSPATQQQPHLTAAALCVNAALVGVFVAASYALLMDLSLPEAAGTQFSAFMGATNACESWAGLLAGSMAVRFGYGAALLIPCAVSVLAMLWLFGLRKPDASPASVLNSPETI